MRISLAVLTAGGLVNAAGLDCAGKAFNCLNSTHFLICVKTIRGVSVTVDDMAMECPPPTECQNYNNFECEMPVPVSQTPISINSETSTLKNTELTTETSLWTNKITTDNIYDTSEAQTIETISEINNITTVIWMDTTEITTKPNYDNYITINETNPITTELLVPPEDVNHNYTTYPIQSETSSSSSLPLTTAANDNLITTNDKTTLVYDQTSPIATEVTSGSQNINDLHTKPALENMSSSSASVNNENTATYTPQNVSDSSNLTIPDDYNIVDSTIEITLGTENQASTEPFMSDTSFTTENTITMVDSVYTSPLNTWDILSTHVPQDDYLYNTITDTPNTLISGTEVFDEVTLATTGESNAVIVTDVVNDINTDVTLGGGSFASSTPATGFEIVEEVTSSFQAEWNTTTKETADNYSKYDTTTKYNEAVNPSTISAETTSGTGTNMVGEVVSSPSSGELNIDTITGATVIISQTNPNLTDGSITYTTPISSETHVNNIEEVTFFPSVDFKEEFTPVDLHQNSTTIDYDTTAGQSTSNILVVNTSTGTNIDMIENVTSSSVGESNIETTTDAIVNISHNDHNLIESQDGSINATIPNPLATNVGNFEDVTSSSGGNWNNNTSTNISVHADQNSTIDGDDTAVTQIVTSTTSGEYTSGIVEEFTSLPQEEWNFETFTEPTIDISQNGNTTDHTITDGQEGAFTSLGDFIQEVTTSFAGIWDVDIPTDANQIITTTFYNTDVSQSTSTTIAKNTSTTTGFDMIEVTSSSPGMQNIETTTDAIINFSQNDNVTEGQAILSTISNSTDTNVADVTTSFDGNWIIDTSTDISVEANQNSTITHDNLAVSQIVTSTTLAENTSGTDTVEELTSSPPEVWNMETFTKTTVDIIQSDNTTDPSITDAQIDSLTSSIVDFIGDISTTPEGAWIVNTTTDVNAYNSENSSITNYSTADIQTTSITLSTSTIPNSSQTHGTNNEEVTYSTGSNWIIDASTEISIDANSANTGSNLSVSQIDAYTTLAVSTSGSDTNFIEESPSSPLDQWNIETTSESSKDFDKNENKTNPIITEGPDETSTPSVVDFIGELTSSSGQVWNDTTTNISVESQQNNTITNYETAYSQSTNTTLGVSTSTKTSVDIVEEVTYSSQGEQNIETNTNANVNINPTDPNVTEGQGMSSTMSNSSETQVTSSSVGNWIIDTSTDIHVEAHQNSTTADNNIAVSQIVASTTSAENTSGSSTDIVEELTTSLPGVSNMETISKTTVDIVQSDNTTDPSIADGQENSFTSSLVDFIEEINTTPEGAWIGDTTVDVNADKSENSSSTNKSTTYTPSISTTLSTSTIPNSSVTHAINKEEVNHSSDGSWIIDTTTEVSIDANQNSNITGGNESVSDIHTYTTLAVSISDSSTNIIEESPSSLDQWSIETTSESTVDFDRNENKTNPSVTEGPKESSTPSAVDVIGTLSSSPGELWNDTTTDMSVESQQNSTTTDYYTAYSQSTNNALGVSTSTKTSVDIVEEVTYSSQGEQNIETNTDANVNINQTDPNVTEGQGMLSTMSNSSETQVTSSSVGNWIIDTSTDIHVEAHQNSTTADNNIAVSQIVTSTTSAVNTSGGSTDNVEELTSSPPEVWNMETITKTTVDMIQSNNTTDSGITDGHEDSFTSSIVDFIEEINTTPEGAWIGDTTVDVNADKSENSSSTNNSTTYTPSISTTLSTSTIPNSSVTHAINKEELNHSSDGSWIIDTTTEVSIDANQNSNITGGNESVSDIHTYTTLAVSISDSSTNIIQESPSSLDQWSIGTTSEFTVDFDRNENKTNPSVTEGQKESSTPSVVDVIGTLSSSSGELWNDTTTNMSVESQQNSTTTDYYTAYSQSTKNALGVSTSTKTSVDIVEEVTYSSQGEQNIETNTDANVNINQTNPNVTEGQVISSTMSNSSEIHVSNIEDVTSSSVGIWIIDTSTDIYVEANQNSTTADNNIAVSQIVASTTSAENTSGSSTDIIEELTSSPPGVWNMGTSTETTVDKTQSDSTTDTSITHGQEDSFTSSMVDFIGEITTTPGGSWIVDTTVDVNADKSENSSTTNHSTTHTQSTSTTLSMSTIPNSSVTNVINLEEVNHLSDGSLINNTTTEVSIDANQNSIITGVNEAVSNINTYTTLVVSISDNTNNIIEELPSSLDQWNIKTTSESTVDFNENENKTNPSITEGPDESSPPSVVDFIGESISSSTHLWNDTTTNISVELQKNSTATDFFTAYSQSTNSALGVSTSTKSSVDIIEGITNSQQEEQNIEINTDPMVNMNQTDPNLPEGQANLSTMTNSSVTQVSNIEEVTTPSVDNWFDASTDISVEAFQNSTTADNNIAVSQIVTSTTSAENTSGGNTEIDHELTSSPKHVWNMETITKTTVDMIQSNSTTDSSITHGQEDSFTSSMVDFIGEITTTPGGSWIVDTTVDVNADKSENSSTTNHSTTHTQSTSTTLSMSTIPNSSVTNVINLEEVNHLSDGSLINNTTTEVSIDANQNSIITGVNEAVSNINTYTTLVVSISDNTNNIIEELPSSLDQWNIKTTSESTVDFNENENKTNPSITEGPDESSPPSVVDFIGESISSSTHLWNDTTTNISVELQKNSTATDFFTAYSQSTNSALGVSTSTKSSVDIIEGITNSQQEEQNIEINTDPMVNMNQTDPNLPEGQANLSTMTNSSVTQVSNIEEVTTPSVDNWFDASTDISVEAFQNSTTADNNIAVSQIVTSTTSAENTSGGNTEIDHELTSSPKHVWNMETITKTTVDMIQSNSTTDSSITDGHEDSFTSSGVNFIEEITPTSGGAWVADTTTDINADDNPNSSETTIDSIEEVSLLPNNDISVSLTVLTPNGLCKGYGRHADLNDCHRFIVCSTHRKPLVVDCPQYTAYSSILQYCTTDMSSCKRKENFECTTEGRFVDQGACSSYYMCIRTLPNTFEKYKLHCIRGMAFDPNSKLCVYSDSCFDKNAGENINNGSGTEDSSEQSQDETIKERHDHLEVEGKSEESEEKSENKSAHQKVSSNEKNKNTSNGSRKHNKNNSDEDRNKNTSNEKNEKPNESEKKQIHWSDGRKMYKKNQHENSGETKKAISENSHSSNSEQESKNIYRESKKKSKEVYIKGDERPALDDGNYSGFNIRHSDRARHGREDLQQPYSSSSKKEPFECDDVGAYADPEDCRKYYVCIPKKSDFKVKHKKCGKNKIFDEVMGRCIRGDSKTCL